MPIPAILAAGAAVMAALYAALPDSVHRIGKEELARLVAGEASDYENELLRGAFASIGLDVDPEQGLTPQALTRAINDGPLAGSGVELSNIFDGAAVRRDLEQLALSYAAQNFGLDVPTLNVEGIKAAVKKEMSRRLMEQLGEGAGDWVALAPDLVDIARRLDAARAAGRLDAAGRFVEPELEQDDYHVNLRERQAKYRAQHSRHWEPR